MKKGILSGCTSGGCGAKIGPDELAGLLAGLHTPSNPDLLVGFDAHDDAAVYRMAPDSAVVSTLDFFSPMVDDPLLFGRIAAANALSDIYAMGAVALFALNLVCFPEGMDKAILAEILRGGAQKLTEAGVALAGGHSIHDREIKYGLAVTGRVDPGRVLRNNGCRPGDRLILTKALGVGIVMAAHRVELAEPEHFREAAASMERLNKYAAEAAAGFSPSACTDVTGFGLLVHLCEMAGKGLGIELDVRALPLLPGAKGYAEEYLLTAAGQRNRRFIEKRLDGSGFSTVPQALQEVMFDPQTSGGLVFAVAEPAADAMLAALRRVEPRAAMIGRVLPRGKSPIIFREGSGV